MEFNNVNTFIYNAQLRNFSDSLIKSCTEVLKRSQQEGDGGRWTNSLFVYLTEQNLGSVSESFNLFTGLRGSILIDDCSFKQTLTPTHLTLNTTFQSPIDEIILDFNWRYPTKKSMKRHWFNWN